MTETQFQEILDNILTEWSFRTHDGMPDLSNKTHLINLEDALLELRLPRTVTHRLVKKLRELDFKNKQEYQDYVKNLKTGEMRPDTKVNIAGKDTTAGDVDKEMGKGSEESEDDIQKKVGLKLNRYQKRAYDEWKNRTKKSYKVVEYLLTDEEKQLMKDFDKDLDKLILAKSDEEKKQILEGMIEKYGLRMNASGSKLYIGNINFDARKIFSGEAGTSLSKLVTSEINRLGVEVQQPESGSDSPKQLATNASKIDYNKKTADGKPTEVVASDSPTLQEILNKKDFQPLDDRPHFKKVWGPTDDKGDLKKSGGTANQEHLKFSIDNDPTLDNIIKQLDELEESHNISPKCREAVEKHKKNMDDLVNGKVIGKDGKPIKVPSEEAAEFVENSWAEMAITITENSPGMANAMMKNLAEKLEYQRELALGDEVYLPSHGSFPSGDKIKVNRDGSGNVVDVNKVSVKYGSSGKYKAYGFPGEAGQYQQWHPDPAYRNRNASRPGVDGYDMGVRDDIIDDDKEFDKMIKESGLEEAVDKDCIKNKAREMKQHIADEKRRSGFDSSKAGVSQRGSVPDQLAPLKRSVEQKNKDLNISECIDMKKLEELIGQDNARLFSKGPMEAVNILTFAGTLNTGDGLQGVTHNHQVIDKGPPVKYVNKTSKGDKNIKYWALGFRGIEKRSGGLISSFNEERKDAGFK